jgi:hypothetical protein
VERSKIARVIFGGGGANHLQNSYMSWRAIGSTRLGGGTKNGAYTVSSGYHMKREEMEKERGSCSNSGPCKEQWRRIWMVRGAQALQMILWKACQNVMPTNDNLEWRHIIPDSLCPLCGLHE